ncbi:MAG TPA: phosphate-starvation-inducible PsiE family protein, partial [Acidimicrobiales bacterium]
MAEAVEEEKEDRKSASGQGGTREGGKSQGKEAGQDPTREDREALPEPEEHPEEVPAPVALLGQLQDFIYYGIAVILLILGAAALGRTATDFFSTDASFTARITHVVNGVLFVVIVLELLRTVLAHFQESTFQLKPFLIIGIISVVRHILTVGAELSIEEEGSSEL